MTRLDETIAAIGPLDDAALAAARRRLDRLTKPPGSLGRLEDLVAILAGITGEAVPVVEPRAIVVMAADHGVAARGVSAFPSTVTGQMVANFLAGGAAISVLARLHRARLVIVDLGTATPPPPHDGLLSRRIGAGTADFTTGPAMTRGQVLAAVDVGLDVAAGLAADDCRLVVPGEMGIGNSTSAAAIVAGLLGRPARDVTGRGTGLDDEALGRKVALIDRALADRPVDPADPIGVLAAVGGFEIAGLVGLILGAAAARMPVVLDGFIVGAAALAAVRLAPALPGRLIAGHRSSEPGHAVVLAALGLEPLLDLGLRLGEGSGAATSLGIVDAAVALLAGMATFDEAAVDDATQIDEAAVDDEATVGGPTQVGSATPPGDAAPVGEAAPIEAVTPRRAVD
jgi:nicotinate-nucleotide--dimethylbenzimidazole phosphoribosyltransferase